MKKPAKKQTDIMETELKMIDEIDDVVYFDIDDDDLSDDWRSALRDLKEFGFMDDDK